jgi:glycosyltransferase involved in cell wall biosynthesis
MDYAIVPAYNEEKNIHDVVKRLRKIGFKVIVVDDGSKDRTYELAKRAGAIVLKHKINKGKGEALRTAFEYAKRRKIKNIVIIDADLQYLPEEAMKLLEPIKRGEADFVMGYRNWREVPFRHKLGNFVWRTFFNILYGTKLKDTNCGYMAFGERAIKEIENIHGGYIIENSILSDAFKKRLRVKQVPVKVFYHKKSGIKRGIRVVLGVLIFILKEGLKYRLSKL